MGERQREREREMGKSRELDLNGGLGSGRIRAVRFDLIEGEEGKGKGRKRECRAVSENWVDRVLPDMSRRWVGRCHHHRCLWGGINPSSYVSLNNLNFCL